MNECVNECKDLESNAAGDVDADEEEEEEEDEDERKRNAR
jgi:hypothetical protein